MSKLSEAIQRVKEQHQEVESRKSNEEIDKSLEAKVRKAVVMYMKDPSVIEVVKDGFMDYWPAIGAKRVGVKPDEDVSAEDIEQFLDIITSEIKKRL